jgi:hypothetical protein
LSGGGGGGSNPLYWEEEIKKYIVRHIPYNGVPFGAKDVHVTPLGGEFLLNSPFHAGDFFSI